MDSTPPMREYRGNNQTGGAMRLHILLIASGLLAATAVSATEPATPPAAKTVGKPPKPAAPIPGAQDHAINEQGLPGGGGHGGHGGGTVSVKHCPNQPGCPKDPD